MPDPEYRRFLQILQDYHRTGSPVEEVRCEMVVLFANQPELLASFDRFIPASAEEEDPYAAHNATQNQENDDTKKVGGAVGKKSKL